ncbi:NADH-ubiquinone oxidoreductase chain 5-like [Humulus lupulus]|uniref:NADH-ubiquinone oxidoreductase chain 5-like n=1 Tax=Humulus lupulus TaxID=3486 RepID=UPI002B415DDB|nr:NADH-ubiquinone oxidoreductase chain 5-like [Humulus lupulus]
MRLNAITLICILLCIGAVGKSAQIGSHTWSPDAMEGPTPVSASIHAATMVTAGVFMIARCSPLFEYPPTALIVITSAGATTSFLAATTGILQNDLKRVIAYSTCSQLGYMIFACGSLRPLIYHFSSDREMQLDQGVDFKIKLLTVDGKRLKLTIWDNGNLICYIINMDNEENLEEMMGEWLEYAETNLSSSDGEEQAKERKKKNV